MNQDTFKNRKVLITGGLGFIGSNLAHSLVNRGAIVTLVDSMIPESGGNFHNIAGIVDCVLVNISDVRDVHSMHYLVKDQDYLFNLAGQNSHMESMLDPYTDLEINCRAQLSILEVCRNHNPEAKVVFTSTRQVYGKPDYLPVDEKHSLRPVDVNGINKLAGEWYHILYNDFYRLRCCVLRLTNTFGPHMRVKDARQTFLGLWIRQLVQGIPIEVWGGSQLRDFTYVADAVNALLLAAAREESNGHIFNLGGTSAISLKDLAELLVEINGGGDFLIKSFPTDRKKIDIGDYYADYSLIRSVLGWEPKITLDNGLIKTIEFYRKNLQHYI